MNKTIRETVGDSGEKELLYTVLPCMFARFNKMQYLFPVFLTNEGWLKTFPEHSKTQENLL